MMHPIDNQYRYGIVYNLDGDIVGFNLSPDVYVPLTDREIERALENYVTGRITIGRGMDEDMEKYTGGMSDDKRRSNRIS